MGLWPKIGRPEQFVVDAFKHLVGAEHRREHAGRPVKPGGDVLRDLLAAAEQVHDRRVVLGIDGLDGRVDAAVGGRDARHLAASALHELERRPDAYAADGDLERLARTAHDRPRGLHLGLERHGRRSGRRGTSTLGWIDGTSGNAGATCSRGPPLRRRPEPRPDRQGSSSPPQCSA